MGFNNIYVKVWSEYLLRVIARGVNVETSKLHAILLLSERECLRGPCGPS